jgi:hypothetical protein
MPSFTQLILALWAGSLWTICGLVTPGLFLILADDHQLAGNIAAQFFYAETFLGLALGVLYLLLARGTLNRSSVISATLAIAMPLVFFLLLRPLMANAHAAGDMARFGQLHGLASLVFLIACGGVGVVVWRSASKHPAA